MREGDDMDMNWQAMLHEAADASFEKNIESLAAADRITRRRSLRSVASSSSVGTVLPSVVIL